MFLIILMYIIETPWFFKTLIIYWRLTESNDLFKSRHTRLNSIWYSLHFSMRWLIAYKWSFTKYPRSALVAELSSLRCGWGRSCVVTPLEVGHQSVFGIGDHWQPLGFTVSDATTEGPKNVEDILYSRVVSLREDLQNLVTTKSKMTPFCVIFHVSLSSRMTPRYLFSFDRFN